MTISMKMMVILTTMAVMIPTTNNAALCGLLSGFKTHKRLNRTLI